MAYGNLIVIDFEGIIYKPGDPQDPEYMLTGTPHEGAKETIKYLSSCGYFIGVVSDQCRTVSGQNIVSNWLKKHNIVVDNLYYRPPFEPVIHITKDNVSSIKDFYNLLKRKPRPDSIKYIKEKLNIDEDILDFCKNEGITIHDISIDTLYNMLHAFDSRGIDLQIQIHHSHSNNMV